MLTGLCILEMNSDGTIAQVIEEDIDSDALDDIMDDKYVNTDTLSQDAWLIMTSVCTTSVTTKIAMAL